MRTSVRCPPLPGELKPPDGRLRTARAISAGDHHAGQPEQLRQQARAGSAGRRSACRRRRWRPARPGPGRSTRASDDGLARRNQKMPKATTASDDEGQERWPAWLTAARRRTLAGARERAATSRARADGVCDCCCCSGARAGSAASARRCGCAQRGWRRRRGRPARRPRNRASGRAPDWSPPGSRRGPGLQIGPGGRPVTT